MYRNQLLTLLERYQQRCPGEIARVERFMAFVYSYPDCFERSLAVGHVTGSAWIVNQTGTHTLLTHHKKLNKWLQPGGHADGNPDVLQAAIREAREETGIDTLYVLSEEIFDVDIHLIPVRGKEADHYHYDVRFVLQTSDSEQYRVSDESHDLAWIEIQQLHQLTQEESMLRMARKWMQRDPPQAMHSCCPTDNGEW